MSYMQTVILSAIETGGKPLSELLESIDAQVILGRLAAEEAEALAELARSRARPEDSMAPLYDRVAELERKVAALEAERAPADPDAPQGPAEEWPEWRQPEGAHDAYRVGDRVTWGGKRWVCAYEGATWTPAEYPAAWTEWAEPEPEAPEQGPETETGEGE